MVWIPPMKAQERPVLAEIPSLRGSRAYWVPGTPCRRSARR
jgi:hypothetical protein